MKRVFNLTLLSVATLFLATSCLNTESDYDKQVKEDDRILAAHMSDNNISAELHRTGFYWEILSTGGSVATRAGAELREGDIVQFQYKLSKLDGTLIENQIGEGKPSSLIKLKNMTVIPQALDAGIALMSVGDTYRFYVPSYLAYGGWATPQFGAYTNFIIEIYVLERVDAEDIATDEEQLIANYADEHYGEFPVQVTSSGLVFVDSIAGEGITPAHSSEVVVDIQRVTLDGKVTMKRESEIMRIGAGNLTAGLEEGLKLMKEGGEAILLLPSSIAFKESVTVVPEKARDRLYNDNIITHNVAPFTPVKYIIKLKSVVK